jgi:hypothetical protein
VSTTPARRVPFRDGALGGAVRQATTPDVFGGACTLLADCSEFQPDISDPVYLRWSPAIVIRAAYGAQHDDGAWYGGARRQALHAGGALFVGIYQYLVGGQDPAAQAAALHGLVGGLQRGEVLIADFEEGQHALLTDWYNAMLGFGYPDRYLWTYTGELFGEDTGALPVQWIASYGANEPASPHTLWQFTDSYTVPGVGTADCSVFHGTPGQLAALAYGGTSSTPGPVTPAPVQPPAPAPGWLRQDAVPTGWSVTFSWDLVPGHDSYHFQLEWWKPGFGWVLSHDTQVTGSRYTLALAPGTRYRWRVAAGAWADWVPFTTS